MRWAATLIRAVDGISLDIEPGEFVALLGQSGSGKSTLLNLLAGLDRPTSGSVLVHGRDLAQMSSEELARYRRNDVGMVFQSFHLIPSMKVTENVELPMRFAEVDRAERAARVRESLERVGLAKRMEHRPSELSGGEQQRVSIARALANRPSLLLADEPTGNLDSRTGEDILNLIRDVSLSLGMTVVMVTHERALAETLRAAAHLSCRRQAAEPGGARVKSYDLFDLAVRNLRQSKLRNGLTTIGISVGVASLVAMLSLGVGLQQLATRRLAGSGMFDTVFVTSRQDFRGYDKEDDAKAPNPDKSPVLDEPARQAITKLPNVTEVEPEMRVMGEIAYGRADTLRIRDRLADVGRENEAFETLKGKFFSSDDADEVVILKDFAKELDDKDPNALLGTGGNAALWRAAGAA